MPEYNSDDSDDENAKSPVKPLFPSSNTVNAVNNQPIKAIELTKDENNEQIPNAVDSNRSMSPKIDQKADTLPKTKQSFASIITGGRSPQHDSIDIQQFISQEQPDDVANQADAKSGETETLPQKTFQRKRRIEFNVSGVPSKRTHQNDDSNESAEDGDAEPAKDVASTIANAKAKYTNFQKGETEFAEPHSANSTDSAVNSLPADEMTNEQQNLEAKLNFLCQGRADVSPVQVIQIQLQVRIS